MTSRAALTVISHGASLTNGLMRSVNSIKKKKKRKGGDKVIGRNVVL